MKDRCGRCRQPTVWSDEILCIVLRSEGLEIPYPLSLAHPMRACAYASCDALYRLVDLAQRSCLATKEAQPWNRAVLVMRDHEALDIQSRHRPNILAQTLVA